MRLLQVSALALGLASLCSFAHEAPDRDSPDRKRDQSVDDYYATSWTQTVTRGGSVMVIVHPHAENHPHDIDQDGVARASSVSPQPCPVSTTSTASMTSGQSIDAPAGSASSSPAPTPPLTIPPPLPSVPTTFETTSSPLGQPAALSPMETTTPYFPTGYPKGPLDSSQTQKCTGGTYDLCVASYDCSRQPYDAVNECHCRNNVREGCWYTCGGYQAPEPEVCPLVPVATRPPNLPGPEEGVSPSTSTAATSTSTRRPETGNQLYDFSLLKRVRLSNPRTRSRRRRFSQAYRAMMRGAAA
ncbi:hypothetical protein TWF481_003927 [Arthrobotrys musiformis]|uniref:Uncharacterized protein n=1 Tax=Arthrobotrys musiformis TaxID=47236 RepID=A0AAV9WJ50_9PEZI